VTDQELAQQIEELRLTLDTLLRIVTRLETRVCKLAIHMGAAHLIETR
jgi:hypothetical protein